MADLPEEILPKLEQLLEQQGTGDEQLLFKLPHMLMWTKLRPGIRDFLVQTHKLFELHIYTHGDQDYAAGMAKLLDPNKTFFGGRVISGVSMSGLKNLAVCLIAMHYTFMPQLILTRFAQLCPLHCKAYIWWCWSFPPEDMTMHVDNPETLTPTPYTRREHWLSQALCLHILPLQECKLCTYTQLKYARTQLACARTQLKYTCMHGLAECATGICMT